MRVRSGVPVAPGPLPGASPAQFHVVPKMSKWVSGVSVKGSRKWAALREPAPRRGGR